MNCIIENIKIEDISCRLVGITIMLNVSTYKYSNSIENKFEYQLDWHKDRPLNGRNWLTHYLSDDDIYKDCI